MKIQYLVLLAFLSSCGGQTTTPPPVVQELPVIQIRLGEAITYQEYPATVEGTINMEIRPQVSGILQRIFIDDGAYVTKGEPLFKIDEAPFREKVNNAKASLHTAQGALSNAQLEIDKLTPLVAGNVISDFQLKTAQSVREVAIGNVEQAKADIAFARINLGYTLIKAPVSGYIGRLLRKEGSIVGPADPLPLTDLSDVHQVHVFFALGEFDFIRFKSHYPGTTIADKIRQLPPVELILADDSAFATKGKIDVVNGRFDSNTGAITFRATFKNDHGLLRSGNTGRIRLGLKFADQLIVPQSATQEMQDKVFVFLVDGDHKIRKQEIIISGKNGSVYLVKGGLKAGDQIVYRGYDHLHEGDLVKPKLEDTLSSLTANH